MEAKDQEILNDPQKTIIRKGGRILFATIGSQPVGCCALLPMGDGEFELSKVAVVPAHQGNGIGRRLMDAAIDEAKRLNARRLYLETNHILTPAIRLYESLGFRLVEPNRVTSSPYARADIFMELLFG